MVDFRQLGRGVLEKIAKTGIFDIGTAFSLFAMLHFKPAMLHFKPVMLLCKPVMLHYKPVMLHYKPAMLHYKPVMRLL
jgi:hypothetical protein